MRQAQGILPAIVGLAVAVIIAAGAVPQSSYDLFQKALTKEKAEGNLEEAIALFQQVVEKGDDEALSAQAQYHIGVCYEKLGLSKARESFQKVIDRYPRQTDAVKAAREKLATLTAPAAKGAASREMNIRRVYDGTGLEWGNALSSDGRYLVYTDWDTGDMAVVDMITRENRRLTHEGGLNKTSGDMGETSVFSPDDKRIAYGWMIGSKIAELRAVNFDGTDPKVLYRDETAIWIRPQGWSQDGRTILMTLMRKDGSSDIALFSLTDNKASIARHVQAKDPEMSLAPGGKAIAYSMSPEPSSSKRDVYLIQTDGTGYEPIVAHPADDYLLGWAPDGKRLIFASDRTGSYGIWSVAIKDGKASGAPQWIKGDLTPSPMRLTPDGTLYYQLIEYLMDVYTVEIDPETGKSLGKPAPIKSRYQGIRLGPDWSPDGTKLAFKAFAGTESKPIGPAMLSVLDLDTGEERQYPVGVGSNPAVDGPRWSPDGRSVFCIGSRGEEQGIFQVEIPSGTMNPLIKFPPHQFTLHAAWSADGKSIFYPQGNPVRILRRDLADGQDTELATMRGPAGIPQITPSPDGKWLAFTSLDVMKEPVRLLVVPASGGLGREIYRTKEGEYVHWLEWTPDGRSIWLMKNALAADPKAKPAIEFLSVSPDGRNIRKLELSVPGRGFRFHPNGRRLAYWNGQGKYELWELENFLSPSK
jgi:Tol biopolymer transport system component